MKAAVIYDGGFAEQGAEGRALQARIAAILYQAGTSRDAVPNCMVISTLSTKARPICRSCASLPDSAGNVAILSHSGGLASVC